MTKVPGYTGVQGAQPPVPEGPPEGSQRAGGPGGQSPLETPRGPFMKIVKYTSTLLQLHQKIHFKALRNEVIYTSDALRSYHMLSLRIEPIRTAT
jgi:hypothetical protein